MWFGIIWKVNMYTVSITVRNLHRSLKDWLTCYLIHSPSPEHSLGLLCTQHYAGSYLLVNKWAWYFTVSSIMEVSARCCGSRWEECSNWETSEWNNVWLERLPPPMILSVFQHIFRFAKIIFPKNESHVTFHIEILPTAFLAKSTPFSVAH